MSLSRALKFRILIVVAGLAAVTVLLVSHELRASGFQARYFSGIAKELKFSLDSGGTTAIRFPKYGPYDERLGYSKIPEFTQLLNSHEFVVTEQARMSPQLLNLELPPIYREKDQAGLDLLDSKQQTLYSSRSPGRVYPGFDAVPKLLIDTLLFIEDRELLDARYPQRNPAVNWSRFDRAVFDQAVRAFKPSHEAPGASTLLTQIEKYRHSPDGRTASARDKLMQMHSASIRAYLDGEDNLGSRRQTVVAYLNTVPLTAKPGYGEINGLGDGMWAWYGRDFSEINELLKVAPASYGANQLQRTAEAYKQALSLMIAQRRPSYYLREGATALTQMTNNHLRLLGAAGIISPELQNAALPLQLHLNQGPVANEPVTSFVSRKAVNALRTDLASLLHVPHQYDLDRFDLAVSTTLDGELQHAVTNVLRQLKSPADAKAAGLVGHNMLSPGDNPGRLTFSFTLFERGADANLLRVQTDNLDQPFDINSGARLNLGSTAKLRTLITYLEIISTLHQNYSAMSLDELRQVEPNKQDVLTRWALDYFIAHPDSNLRDTLEAAMLRTYSGNPGEVFFTGGGMQQFENFEPEENGRIMTVRESFQHSVNLVFVRLMRDIVRYHEFKGAGTKLENLTDDDGDEDADTAEASVASADAIRQAALSRFADKEGREFLVRFYKKYTGKSADEAEQELIDGIRVGPKRLAIIFRSLHPDADFQKFTEFMHEQLEERELGEPALQSLYEKYGIDKYSLNDRGYLAGIHPLELWLVGYLRQHPEGTLKQAVEASRDQRQEVYEWLFKTHNRKTQESRIHQMLELEAFQEIAKDWRRLGYPFEALTPSYATALGASGDRPASLAELMGIIVNKGMRMPTRKLQSMQFARGTPYETHFVRAPAAGQRVLPEEVAELVRRSLIDVVQGGTGVRLKGGFKQTDGTPVEVGGKTGTGDQRFETYGRGGKLIESRAVNRSATFVFLIGDRYFGTITAYVHEPYAADYGFTSALSVQLLKSLIPALAPIEKESVKEDFSSLAQRNNVTKNLRSLKSLGFDSRIKN